MINFLVAVQQIKPMKVIGPEADALSNRAITVSASSNKAEPQRAFALACVRPEGSLFPQ
jgi:hypothetical protein